jgi:hypothetical protein
MKHYGEAKFFIDGVVIGETKEIEVIPVETERKRFINREISGALKDVKFSPEFEERMQHLEYMRRHFGNIKALGLNGKVMNDLFKGWKSLKEVTE